MKKLLPVVHVANRDQALAQVDAARNAGADGAWLINHVVGSATLTRVFIAARGKHPDFWLGLNFLDHNAEQAMAAVVALSAEHRVDGLWTDNAGVDERAAGPEDNAQARRIWTLKHGSGWLGLYFGGVAFKHQRRVTDVEKAAVVASEYVDVVTTSGDATGVAARVEKIAAMKSVLGSAPLAVASGITPENVGAYLPHVDYFLVATGISRSFYELAPDKTRQLADLIHGAS